VVWPFALLVVPVLLRREGRSLTAASATRRVLLPSALAAGWLGVNWLVYIWGVNSGHMVESSLGYFINPLVSVLLVVLFFKERLRPLQWTAVGLAAGGVIYLTIRSGAMPWISLALLLYWLEGRMRRREMTSSQSGQPEAAPITQSAP
jgi:chloramphenicol-sensitive protein RarD